MPLRPVSTCLYVRTFSLLGEKGEGGCALLASLYLYDPSYAPTLEIGQTVVHAEQNVQPELCRAFARMGCKVV